MRIPWKLSLIVLIMVVPTIFGTYTVWQTDTRVIEDVALELQAAEYLGAIQPLFEHVPQHRGTAAGLLGGDLTAEPRLQASAAKVNEALEGLQAVDLRLGATLGTSAELAAIVQTWRELSGQVRDLEPADSFQQHTELIEDVIAMMQTVALNGRLIGDPAAESSILVGVLINELPIINEHLGRLRGLGNGIAARTVRTVAETARLTDLVTLARGEGRRIDGLLEGAFNTSPRLRDEVSVYGTPARTALDAFLTTVETEILGPDELTIVPELYFAQGTETITRYFDLYNGALDQLRVILQERADGARNQRNFTLLVAGGITLLASLVAFFFARGITRQLDAITTLFSQIGIGDFDARAPVVSNDELGVLASSLNSMLDNTLALLQSQEERDQIQQSIQKLMIEIADAAEGDLTVEAEVTTEVTGAIADSFNFLIAQLRTVISRVQDTTLHVSSAASEIQATAEHLAQGSEAQSEQIINTTAAVDEMAASISQVSENAASAATVAQQALTNARQGNSAVVRTMEGMTGMRQQVQETAKRMKRLGESSQEVGEIVQLIADIADRTSILALNASIQAAMAGEAGRGFAVVAEEVERLAERSASATKRIEGLIKTIQIETSEAVGAMEETTREVVSGTTVANEAGAALQEIEGVSVRLAELIGAISQSAKQQARGSESVARSMGEISEVTQQTAAGTKQAAVSISNMAELADELRDSVSTFKLPGHTA